MTTLLILKQVALDLLVILPVFFFAAHFIVWFELGFRIVG